MNFLSFHRKQDDNRHQKKGTRLIVEEISSEEAKENVEPNINASHSNKKGNRLKIEEIESESDSHKDKTNLNDNRANIENSKDIPRESESNTPQENMADTTNSKVEVITPKELPEDSVTSKNEGNALYKNGQYPEAYQKYTFAIQSLMIGNRFHSKFITVHPFKLGTLEKKLKTGQNLIDFPRITLVSLSFLFWTI